MALRKTAPNGYTAKFPGEVRLWRDDLAKIQRIVQECSDGPVKITADNYELDDADDLAQLED